MDASAFGKLYASPLSLQTFEQDAGQTNKSRVRIELNAQVGVERQAAAVGSRPRNGREEAGTDSTRPHGRGDRQERKPHFYGEKVKLSDEEAKPLLKEGKVSKE